MCRERVACNSALYTVALEDSHPTQLFWKERWRKGFPRQMTWVIGQEGGVFADTERGVLPPGEGYSVAKYPPEYFVCTQILASGSASGRIQSAWAAVTKYQDWGPLNDRHLFLGHRVLEAGRPRSRCQPLSWVCRWPPPHCAFKWLLVCSSLASLPPLIRIPDL